MGCHSKVRCLVFSTCAAFLLSGCGTAGRGYSPATKLHPDRLREDFRVLRGALEDLHPSLHAYTPKPALDALFDGCMASVIDSMTEPQFAHLVVARAVSGIRCGHTSVSLSKRYTKAMQGVRQPSFPLLLKTWGDTMVVTRNLDQGDSSVRRGDLVTSVNGMGPADLRSHMSMHLSADGFNETLNEIRLSTAFPFYHRNVFGLSKEYRVGYVDSGGRNGVAVLPFHKPVADTMSRAEKAARQGGERPPKRPTRKDRFGVSFVEGDRIAVMEIASFQHSLTMKGFYRRAFRDMRKRGTEHLVIDIRNNGGGNVDNQVRLARYLKRGSFRVADTAAAVTRNLGTWRRHLDNSLFNSLLLRFVTRKGDDGKYHLRYWERHLNRPKRKGFYEGDVYLVVGGPTFSAASLFARSLKGQANVTLVGEETGGGAHSNNGLLIPTLTLPNTGIRVRLPLFRLVPDRSSPDNGRGVMPDVVVRPTVDAVRKGIDRKMETVRRLIRERTGR